MKKFEEKYSRRRYRAAYSTTIFSITVVMFMLGLLVLTVFHTNRFSKYVRENIGIQLELADHVSDRAALALNDSLNKTTFVRKSEFVSRKEAARRLSEELGENFVDFMGYIPLPSTIEIFLHSPYTVQDSIARIEDDLLKNPAIQKITYQKSLVSLINENLERIGVAVIVFAVLLLVISVILIYNTIRLAVFSRRLLIKSMLLVGATQAFIRKPFIVGGIWQGLISGSIAGALLLVIMAILNNKLPSLDMFGNIPFLILLFILMLVFAALITFLSNYFAVKKYLKINSEELY